MQRLYHTGNLFGTVRVDYLFKINWKGLAYGYRTLAELCKNNASGYKTLMQECASFQNRGLYFGDKTCLRSPFCFGEVSGNTATCRACQLLGQEPSIRKRKANTNTPGVQSRNDYLSFNELAAKAKQVSQRAYRKTQQLTRGTGRFQVLEKRMAKVLQCAETWDDLPTFFHNLRKAHKVGHLEKHPHLIAILNGISECLKNGTRRGRRMSKSEEQFYTLLLNAGGAWAHDFVSNIFLGPDIRTTKEKRSAIASVSGIELEFSESCFAHLVELLKVFKLEDAPGIIAEGGSTVLRRLDWEKCTHEVNGALRHGVMVYASFAYPTHKGRFACYGISGLDAFVVAPAATAFGPQARVDVGSGP